MNNTILELCTECLYLLLEHLVKDVGVDVITLLKDKDLDLTEDEESLKSMMAGYCLARGYTLDEMNQSTNPKLEEIINNLIEQYQEK